MYYNPYSIVENIGKMRNQVLDIFPRSKPVRNVPEYARKKEQSRNELCKCGSGKKYKNCCGK